MRHMTVVTWQDSPSTATPVDAAELNAAFAGCMQADGTVTATATQKISVTMSGANKVVQQWIATDGKTYGLVLTTTNGLRISNITDNVIIAEFGPGAGAMTLNGATVPTVGAHSTSAFTLSAGAGAPATLATGEIYFQLS